MQPPLASDNGTAPPRFRIGDLEVDVGKAEVTRGDEKIASPKLSFDLLCALINAAPAIVTNDDLLQKVWPGLVVSPESVAQRVKLLRSAIGDDSQQPRYILGVRGRGYRLIPLPERCESQPPIGDAVNPSINTSNPNPKRSNRLAQALKTYAPYLPSGIAAIYAFRAEPDEAFKWLERAYAQRDPLLYRIKFTTEFDKLHDDPRHKAFLKKMNLAND